MDSAPAHLVHTEEALPEESTLYRGPDGSNEPGTRSSAGEQALHTRQVVGSIPTASTTPKPPSKRYQRHQAAKAEPRKPSTVRGHPVTPTVYFVQAKALGLIKIGVTVDLNDRIKTLRVGSPDHLELIGAIYHRLAADIERRLHGKFQHDRSHGEWFRPSDDLLAFIAKHSMESYEDARNYELLAALRLAYGRR